MALHRDIYWVGRQWAVTGYGIQACDQKQKGRFDIEASKLWQDGVQESVRALKWLNSEDFDKAVSVARKYYPEPPRKAPPPKKPVSRGKDNAPPPKPPRKAAQPDKPVSQTTKDNVPAAEPPKPVVQTFEMRGNGLRAKFLRVWRIRARVGGR